MVSSRSAAAGQLPETTLNHVASALSLQCGKWVRPSMWNRVAAVPRRGAQERRRCKHLPEPRLSPGGAAPLAPWRAARPSARAFAAGVVRVSRGRCKTAAKGATGTRCIGAGCRARGACGACTAIRGPARQPLTFSCGGMITGAVGEPAILRASAACRTDEPGGLGVEAWPSTWNPTMRVGMPCPSGFCLRSIPARGRIQIRAHDDQGLYSSNNISDGIDNGCNGRLRRVFCQAPLQAVTAAVPCWTAAPTGEALLRRLLRIGSELECLHDSTDRVGEAHCDCEALAPAYCAGCL